MKKLTAGIFAAMLGFVATGANAAITSKAYVDGKIDAVNEALETKAAQEDLETLETSVGNTSTLTTTSKVVTGAINELNTNKVTSSQVTQIIENSITNNEGALYKKLEQKADTTQVAADIAAAVEAEATRAKAAEKENADAISAINDKDTGILKKANDYTDTEIGKINTALDGYATSDDLDDINATVSKNTEDIAKNKTAVEKAQADATKALNESIAKVTAQGTDGTFVLTMKKVGDNTVLQWEDIARQM